MRCQLIGILCFGHCNTNVLPGNDRSCGKDMNKAIRRGWFTVTFELLQESNQLVMEVWNIVKVGNGAQTPFTVRRLGELDSIRVLGVLTSSICTHIYRLCHYRMRILSSHVLTRVAVWLAIRVALITGPVV